MAQYIDKDALVAKIQKRLKFQQTCIETEYRLTGKAEEEIILEYNQLLSFINTLEVKEVDLEKEFDDYIEKQNAFTNNDTSEIKYCNGDSFNHVYDIYPIAKHFFELGLKAQKGE